jgi:hypothetical protein
MVGRRAEIRTTILLGDEADARIFPQYATKLEYFAQLNGWHAVVCCKPRAVTSVLQYKRFFNIEKNRLQTPWCNVSVFPRDSQLLVCLFSVSSPCSHFDWKGVLVNRSSLVAYLRGQDSLLYGADIWLVMAVVVTTRSPLRILLYTSNNLSCA